MGLGKTVITLTAIRHMIFDTHEVSKVLVVAPLRVARDTWPQEIGKWDHLKNLTYSVIVGDQKTRIAAVNKEAMVYIINRENIKWLVDYCHSQQKWNFDFDMIVLDELSSFKNYRSQRFKYMKLIRPYAKRIVGLTGTPTSNGLMDLWAEIGILDQGQRLGRYIGRYREKYFIPLREDPVRHIVYSYAIRPGAEKEIYGLISDITISMRAKDYLHIPECICTTYEVSMDLDEWEMYETLKDELVLSLRGTSINASNAATLSGKLLQMANGAAYDSEGNIVEFHDRKLDALEDIIESANGNPLLVAYWFKHDLERIRKRFDVREIKTSKDITDWNAGKIPVAMIHPASAGHGLNLQSGGSTLVWFGLTWSLELYQQTNARLWRQGQTSGTVVIQHIIAKGTIDERVLKALSKKELTQNALIDAVKADLGENK